MSESVCDAAMYELVDVDNRPTIAVDAEFSRLIPPLSAEELRELEKSIVQHGGAREPVIVWDRGHGMSPILLDGHNRMAICDRLGLPYSAKGLRFQCRADAAMWMRRNQLGRRNVSRNTFMLMLGDLYNRTKAEGRWKATTKGRRADHIAREHGLNEKTVRRAGKFRDAAEKLGVIEDIASGRIKATVDSVIAVAGSLPPNPTRHDVSEAVRNGLSRVSVGAGDTWRGRPEKPSRESQTWLVPAEPTECLKAIRFYAKCFTMRAPESMEALHSLLSRLIEEIEEPDD